jgi:hypothetical protein
MVSEEKGTCCGKCGHVHVKGTSCPRPFLTGKSHCKRKANENLKDPDDNPCWDGYHPVGTKMKDGREVPNCVPVSEDLSLEGLWANINAKRARGEKGARKGSEAYKKAVAAGNKLDEAEETSDYCPSCLAEYLLEYEHKIEEAEYKGRKVSLGKPFLTPDGPKKRSVYVKNAKGNVVKVNFGDPNMRIKKSIPARRRSYRARHHCENPGPKWKANYWSCKAW